MIHLVGSSPLFQLTETPEESDRTAPDSTSTESFDLQSFDGLEEALAGGEDTLTVLENLGRSYPLELVSSASTLDQGLSAQALTAQVLVPTTIESPRPIHADAVIVQPYPDQALMPPRFPVRARPRLPQLPLLEVGSGLLAFSIVSGVVILDGMKQARNVPNKPVGKPLALANPSETVVGRQTQTPAMSQAELLPTNRSLPMPRTAMNAPIGGVPGMPNFGANPGQLPSVSLAVPPMPTFSGGFPEPAKGTTTQQPAAQNVKAEQPLQPAVQAVNPPVRTTNSLPPRTLRPPVQTEPIPQAPIPQAPIPPRAEPLPVPADLVPRSIPVDRAPTVMPSPHKAENHAPSIGATPLPTPSPSMPVIQQSMLPRVQEVPAEIPIIESAPRQAMPTDNPIVPQVMSSIPPIEPISQPTQPPSATVVQSPAPKDLVFSREVN